MTAALGWASARQTADSAQERLRSRMHELAADAEDRHERDFLVRLEERICAPDARIGRFGDATGRVFDVLTRDQLVLRDVARALERDPELVLDVWKAAWPRLGNPSGSIEQAVSRLGPDQLWRIAVLDAEHAPSFVAPGYEVAARRERALALMTANLAGASLPGQRETAYLAGLLHNTGSLLVYRCAVPLNPSHVPARHLVERAAEQLRPLSSAVFLDGRRLKQAVVQAVAHAADPTYAPAGARQVARAVFAGRAVAMHVCGMALTTRFQLYQRLERIDMKPATANRLLYLARQAHGHVGDLLA